MATTTHTNTNEVVDDLIKRYANSHDTTFTDIVVKFFKGVYSYPDDLGMALAVSVSGTGLLGPRMQQAARSVTSDLSMILCTVVAHRSDLLVAGRPSNLWYFGTKYREYLATNGRWKAKLASVAGRTVGGQLTSMALARVQLAAGVDPRHVTRLDRIGVAVSMFALVSFGAACHAILAGERSFLGVLNRIITGEVDPALGALQLELRFDAPWRNAIPKDANGQVEEMRSWLQSVCVHSTSVTKGAPVQPSL